MKVREYHLYKKDKPHFSTFVVAEMMNATNVTVKEDNTGLIVLVIVLIALLLAGVGFLVWFFVFYRKKAKSLSLNEASLRKMMTI